MPEEAETITGVYDSVWFTKDDDNVVMLFTRKDGKKKIQTFRDVPSYFYINEEEYEKHKSTIDAETEEVVKDVDKVYVKDNDVDLYKCVCENQYAQYRLNKSLPEAFETDVGLVHRFSIDNFDEFKAAEYRIHYFDIETTTEHGFPNHENPVEKITSIAGYDSYEEEDKLWIWHKDYDEETVKREEDGDEFTVYRFSNEHDLLESYMDHLQNTKPDILTAWNAPFDVNYLAARCEQIGVNVDKLSPLFGTKPGVELRSNKRSLTRWKKGANAFGSRVDRYSGHTHNLEVLGLQWFDLLSAYQMINAKEMQSWSLDYVSKKEFDFGKHDTDFDIQKAWEENPKKIETYNYVDTKLLRMIDEKRGLIDYYNRIKDMAKLDNINKTSSSGVVLDAYIRSMNADRYVFPSKPYDNKREPVAGGFVHDSPGGIYENVVVIDFSAYYPSLIKTFNLSGDMIEEAERIKYDTSIDEERGVEMFEDFEPVVEDDIVTYRIRTQKYKADLKYDISRPGVMGESVDALMDLRQQAKDKLAEAEYGTDEYQRLSKREQSYKFIINAAYGTSAYPGFRLFSADNANAITGFARMLSKWVTYRVLEETGVDTVYGDTDSLFLQLPDGDLDDNLEILNETVMPVVNDCIEEFVNMFLPEDTFENVVEMDIEKIYSTLIKPSSKKKYIGKLKWYDGEVTDDLHYKGLDLKKSNTIQISKEAQKQIAEAIFEGEDVKSVMSELYKRIEESDDVDLFKKSSKLTKPIEEYDANTPATRAAEWSNANLGTEFRNGTKFYTVYVKERGDIDTDVIAFNSKFDLEDIDFEVRKAKYYDDLYSKINNLIGDVPKYRKMNDECYTEYAKGNTTLGQWT